jgi:hypothetical protein
MTATPDHNDPARTDVVARNGTQRHGTDCPELMLLLDQLTAERHRPVPPPPAHTNPVRPPDPATFPPLGATRPTEPFRGENRG